MRFRTQVAATSVVLSATALFAAPVGAQAVTVTTVAGELHSVSAGATDAWAVGDTFDGETLALHWSGTSWDTVPTVSPGGITRDDLLLGVSEVSSTEAYAVGYYSKGRGGDTTAPLIERWNGASWTQMTSVNPSDPGTGTWLTGVTATANNAWAVGYYRKAGVVRTLTEHWNGTKWTKVRSPSPGASNNYLTSVDMLGPNDIWAGGSWSNGTTPRTLVEHWNGGSWTKVPSPDPGTGGSVVNDVIATSTGNAWAVGDYQGSGSKTLAMQATATQASKVTSFNPVSPTIGSELDGVTFDGGSTSWAVGQYYDGSSTQTLIESSSGGAWSQVASPSPGGTGLHHLSQLHAVSASSPSNAWAVGKFSTGTTAGTLIEHWDGFSWTQS